MDIVTRRGLRSPQIFNHCCPSTVLQPRILGGSLRRENGDLIQLRIGNHENADSYCDGFSSCAPHWSQEDKGWR